MQIHDTIITHRRWNNGSKSKTKSTGDWNVSSKSCDFKVHVKKGDKIPNCPYGKNEYDKGTQEPGRKNSNK